MNTLSIHASYLPRTRVHTTPFILCYHPTTSGIVSQHCTRHRSIAHRRSEPRKRVSCWLHFLMRSRRRRRRGLSRYVRLRGLDGQAEACCEPALHYKHAVEAAFYRLGLCERYGRGRSWRVEFAERLRCLRRGEGGIYDVAFRIGIRV